MLESYITPLLTSFLSRYIKNLKPADLQLSFWGGDAVLKNLELHLDAIEAVLSAMVPFELKSGNVKQLTVHIPWTSIGSEPIELTMESVECTVKLKSLDLLSQSKNRSVATPSALVNPPIVADGPQAPGYLQGLLNRIINNVILRVKNLTVKVIEEHCDLLMAVSVKHIKCFSTTESWEEKFIFTDSFHGDYSLYNCCSVSNMTICLDLIGSSGQVEVFEKPFVPKCSYDCRLARVFRQDVLIETKLDMFIAGELCFSVTEQQFNLFLHLLDWLLAMYYSYKELKGRDDLRDNTEVKQEGASRCDDYVGSQEEQESGKPEEVGWGSWMMSFFTGEEGDNGSQSKGPPLPPALCLSVHASSVSVTFDVSKKHSQPIFPANFTREQHINHVLLIKLTGCLSRLVRAPGSSFLGFCVGIMSVNAWATGECPCMQHNFEKRKKKTLSTSPEEVVPVYSLSEPDEFSEEKLVAGSLFDQSTAIGPDHDVYLKHRDVFKGVWFSYRNVDVNTDLEVEQCSERMIVGETRLLLTADVIHRLLAFMRSFFESLEASPLLSRGVSVIGDPRSKTDFVFSTGPFKVLLTSNSHLILRPRLSSHPNPVPTLLMSCDSLEGKFQFPTYSDCATSEFPQCHLAEVTASNLSVDTLSFSAPALSSIPPSSQETLLIKVPSLSLSYYKQMRGDTCNEEDIQYLQAKVDQADLILSQAQCHSLYTLSYSWISSDSVRAFTVDQDSHKSFLHGQVSSSNIEWCLNESETVYSLVLGRVYVSLVSALRSIPILQCPYDTKSWNKAEYWITKNQCKSSPILGNAVEINLCLPNKTTKGGIDCPHLKITVAGLAALIDHSLLEYVMAFPLHLLQDLTGGADEDVSEEQLPVVTAVGRQLQSCYLEVCTGSPVVVWSLHHLARDRVCDNQLTSDLFSFLIFSSSSFSMDEAAVLVFPSLELSSSTTALHPGIMSPGDLSDSQSWHCNLTEAAIFTLLPGDPAGTILHPLSQEVCITTIRPARGSGAMGAGVHIDVDCIHLTLTESQVALISKLVSAAIDTVVTVMASGSSPSLLDVSSALKETSSNSSHSLASIPHLSLSRQPSESSASTYSLPSPSLWIQLTVSRVVVELSPSEQNRPVSRKDFKWYTVEIEDTSLSVDTQGQSTSYQLKIFSLEAYKEKSTTGSKGETPFIKLFSSTRSILRDSVKDMVEVQWLPRGAVVVPPSPANFLTIDVVTSEESHRPMEIKAITQSFECVLELTALDCVLELVRAAELSSLTCEGTVTQAIPSDLNRHWPQFDIHLKCFHLFLPTSSPSSFFMANCGEVTVTSDLLFPIGRHIIAPKILQKIIFLSEEMRYPPLPGYQAMATSFSVRMMAVTENYRVLATPISTPTNIKLLFSPALFDPSPPHNSLECMATGHMIETHVDNDVSLQLSQTVITHAVHLINEISSLRLFAGQSLPEGSQLSTSLMKTTPFQVLFTGKAVQLLVCGAGEPQQLQALRISFFNPLILVTSLWEALSIEMSLLDISSFFTNNGIFEEEEEEEEERKQSSRVCSSLLETRVGTSEQPANVFTVKVFYSEQGLPASLTSPTLFLTSPTNSLFTPPPSATMTAAVGRPIKLTLSPVTMNNLLDHVTALTTSPLLQSRPQADPFAVLHLLSGVKVTTQQCVLELIHLGEQEKNIAGEGFGMLNKPEPPNVGAFLFSWQELTITSDERPLPSNGSLPSSAGDSFREGASEGDVTYLCLFTGPQLSYRTSDGDSAVVVSTTDVSLNVSHHSPLSVLDKSHIAALLQCSLVQVHLTYQLMAAAQQFILAYYNRVQWQTPHSADSQDTSSSSELRSEAEYVLFEDDLRSEQFKFVTKDNQVGGRGLCPSAGEVSFVEEGEGQQAAMVWHYPEPRTLTRVIVAPVPLSVNMKGSSQPACVEVVCKLCYWESSSATFAPLASISVSETSSASVVVPAHQPARKWALLVSHLEWEDEEESLMVKRNTPTSCPGLYFNFSPQALACCTRIDSSLNCSTIPRLIALVEIKELSLEISHSPSTRVSQPLFKGMRVIDDISHKPLQLIHSLFTDVSSKFTLLDSQAISMEVSCTGCSLKCVDMQDLTWLPIVSSTRLQLKCTTRKLTKAFSTSESVALPSGCCLGYIWRNHHISPKMIQVLIDDCTHFSWSEPFSIDQDGEVIVSFSRADGSLSKSILLVQVTSVGGVQKEVKLAGSLSFSSSLPVPLSLALSAAEDSSAEQESVSLHSEKLTLPANEEDGLLSVIMPCDTSVRICQASQTGFKNWSAVLPINMNKNWSKPNLITEVPSQRMNETFQCWTRCNIAHCTDERLTVKITLEPILVIVNNLPFDLQMSIAQITNASDSESVHWLQVAGRGQKTTPLQIKADQSYSVSFSHHNHSKLSSPIKFSMDQLGLVPVKNCCCDCLWPFDKCHHYEHSTELGSHDLHMTISTPSVESNHECVCKLVSSIQRNSTLSSTITLTLSPLFTLVNKLPVPLTLTVNQNEESQEEVVEPNLLTWLSQPKFLFGVSHAQCMLSSSEVSLTCGEALEQVELRIRSQLPLQEEAYINISCLVNVRRINHEFSVVCVLEPAFLLVNRTGLPLSVCPSLSPSAVFKPVLMVPAGIDTDPINSCTIPVLFWQKSSHKKSLVLSVTADKSCSKWSIPLSLKFVRRSFSLPASQYESFPSLFSTHYAELATFIAISKDTHPRLVLTNHCPTSLEVVEYGIASLHHHPQLVDAGQAIAYEPPTLAKQYPLLNDSDSHDKDKGGFKTMKDVSLKFKIVVEGSDQNEIGGLIKEPIQIWSKAIHLLPDCEQVVTIPSYKSIFITTTKDGGTLNVNILPVEGDSLSLFPCTSAVAPVNHVTIECCMEQLVISLDEEKPENKSVISPVVRLISTNTKLLFSQNSDHCKGTVSVDDLQIDSVHPIPTGKVILLPRRSHNPPHHLIHSEVVSQPFICISFEKDPVALHSINSIIVSIQPTTLQVDDSLLNRMKSVLEMYQIAEIAQLPVSQEDKVMNNILSEINRDETPVVIDTLVVEPLTGYVSAKVTAKVTISCDDSLLSFPHYKLSSVYSNWAEVSNCLATHYTTQFLWQAMWGVGSLDLIGSPAVFLHSVQTGLQDLVRLSYEGFIIGPEFFMLGIGRGISNLAGSLSRGALRSVTNFSSGVAHNLEVLSLDPDHLSYQVQYSQPPQHLTSGIISGASSFGLSMVSALAGVVDQPMRSIQSTNDQDANLLGYTKSILKGVGKGLLGVVTKPVGGALQLISQTGQGLMSSTGLSQTPQCKITSSDEFFVSLSRREFFLASTKIIRLLQVREGVLCTLQGSFKTNLGKFIECCIFLLTTGQLLVVRGSGDQLLMSFSIHKQTIGLVQGNTSNTLLVQLKVIIPLSPGQAHPLASGHQVGVLTREELAMNTAVLELQSSHAELLYTLFNNVPHEQRQATHFNT